MPIYEEKLISPLAIRFTQQRIRTTFRDGRDVEATIKEVEARPGVGDYDIILRAPFPTIEILRWAPNGRSSGGKEHWFSFDNRRLYCLQRIAAEYWPKRVGATVEVLYCDSGAIRKKLDSQTCGMSVSIGHAFASADELKEWSWHKAVQLSLPDLTLAVRAETGVLTDDAKASVGELTDAEEPSSVERLTSHCHDLAEIPTHTSYKASQTETILTEEGDGKQGSSICVAAEAPFEDGSLAGLIGQLLDLNSTDREESPELLELKSTDCTESPEPVTDAASTSASQSLSTPSESVADLIGQLLELKLTDCSESPDGVTDAASTSASQSFSTTSESVESNAGVSKHTSSDVESDILGYEPSFHSSLDSASAATKQKRSGRRADKESRLAQQELSFKAAQFQMAQQQMAQWQMAQWHTAQMAQWEAMQFQSAWW